MKISVFGLGYVGAVTTACLAREGFSVVGVDINPEKADCIAKGRAPIVEIGLNDLLSAGVKAGRITATTSAADAVNATDMSLISVATPSSPNGVLDSSIVLKVCSEIGTAMAAKGASHVVIIRSTVFPGTTRKCAELLRQAAGKVPVHVAYNPEFLREGDAIRDFDEPPYKIFGVDDPEAARALHQLYETIPAPTFLTTPEVAELIKLASNAWHAAKVGFANEIGRVAKAVGVDGREVMNILIEDNKLNVSRAYLRPGFAYGGSCLPKDVRSLISFARSQGLPVPMMTAITETNRVQVEMAVQRVLATGKRRVGLLGLAFKEGTDDLRESAAVELAERLMKEGCELRILDAAVRQARLVGANREYIEKRIPHFTSLLVDNAAELLRHAEAIVVTHGAAEFRALISLVGPDVPILDLAGILLAKPQGKRYDGIAW